MKKSILSVSILGLAFFNVFAQPGGPPGGPGAIKAVYPYVEDFESATFPSFGGKMPDWVQTASPLFSTKAARGAGNPASKGLTKEFNKFTVLDSIVSPYIGAINSNSVFAFDYRIALYTAGYPSAKPQLGSDFFIKVYAVKLSIQTLLFTIDATNHKDSLKFQNFQINMPSILAGDSINLKFVVNRGAVPSSLFEDFNVEFDNIKVIDASLVGLKSVNKSVNNIIIQNNFPDRSIQLLSNSKISAISIVGVDGKQVYNTNNYLSGNSINLDNAGIYILEYKCDGIIERKKFVIE